MNAIFRTLLLGIGVIAASFTAEVTTRAISPSWLEARMRIVRAGNLKPVGTDEDWPVERYRGIFYRFKPHSSFTSSHFEFQHQVTIDEYGGRTINGLATHHERIVPFIGDSFAFGVGVSDAETYVNLLQQQSSERFLNLGVPGTGLAQQLDLLELRHTELGRPDLYVFTFYVGNDFSDLVFRRERVDQRGAAKSDSTRIFGFANGIVHRQPWLRRSYFVQLLKQKAQFLANWWNPTSMEPIFLSARLDSDYLDRARRYLDAELDRLEHLSNTLGFRSAFLIVPDRYQLDATLAVQKRDYYGLTAINVDMRRPTYAITAALQSRGITYLDLSPCLARQREQLYYVQDHHFTAAGHRAAAECARSWLGAVLTKPR